MCYLPDSVCDNYSLLYFDSVSNLSHLKLIKSDFIL